MSDAPVIVVAGPTASGKSGLALAIAEELAGTIINADSMQVYRDLRVLTARPDEADEAKAPHRLYGYRDVTEVASAADWAEDARDEIGAARTAGRRPVIVGGTGLYLKTLMEGIAAVPPVPDEVRVRARARRDEIGADAFFAELATRDPEIAERLHAGDPQRVLRAWEVHEATGRALSAWQQDPVPPTGEAFRVVVLQPSREELHEAIESRFAVMQETGAVDEVRDLASRAVEEELDPALPLFKALGYPALSAHLRGELSLQDAARQSIQQTRSYAKRQMTWLRTQLTAGEDRFLMPIEKYNYSKMDEIFSFIT